MPDELDNALNRALYGWGVMQWCTRHQIGAASAYYCNLCGERLADSPHWPFVQMHRHRKRYVEVVKTIEENDLVILGSTDDRWLRMIAAGVLFPSLPGSSSIGDTNDPRFHIAPRADVLTRIGGYALGCLICLPRAYNTLKSAELSIPQFACAIRLAVRHGVVFWEAVEGAADVKGLLGTMIDQQLDDALLEAWRIS